MFFYHVKSTVCSVFYLVLDRFISFRKRAVVYIYTNIFQKTTSTVGVIGHRQATWITVGALKLNYKMEL